MLEARSHQTTPGKCRPHQTAAVMFWLNVLKFPPPVHQRQAKKPTICSVYLNFPKQLTLTAYPKKIPDEQHFEEQHRINGWTPIARTMQTNHFVVDKIEIDCLVDMLQERFARNKCFNVEQRNFYLLLYFCVYPEKYKSKALAKLSGLYQQFCSGN
jgi:hypothetical protein